MAASFQEQFIGQLSKASLGAYSIFEPDTYRKGNAIREPADLAWFNRDAVILLNLQSGGAGQAKHDVHNVRQLEGWMRAWARGRRLAGSNESRGFAIALEDVTSVLLVSVSGDPAAEMRLLTSSSKGSDGVHPKVSAIVSIPETVLLHLAQLGGAAIDLADLVLRVAAEGGRASVSEAKHILASHREWSVARALSDSRIRNDRDQELDNWIFSSMATGLRQAVVQSNAATLSPHFDTFNDLDWQATALLSLSCADAFRTVRDVPFGEVGPIVVGLQLDLDPYRFFVAACDINKQEEFSKSLAEAESKIRNESAGKPVIGVRWHMVGRPVVKFASSMLTFGEAGIYETATADALRQIQKLCVEQVSGAETLEA